MTHCRKERPSAPSRAAIGKGKRDTENKRRTGARTGRLDRDTEKEQGVQRPREGEGGPPFESWTSYNYVAPGKAVITRHREHLQSTMPSKVCLYMANIGVAGICTSIGLACIKSTDKPHGLHRNSRPRCRSPEYLSCISVRSVGLIAEPCRLSLDHYLRCRGSGCSPGTWT